MSTPLLVAPPLMSSAPAPRPAMASTAHGVTAASTVLATLAMPVAGSYTLDHIMAAPDGQVQDSDGSVHRLSEFTTGKITVLSFIYTACSDALGCPLALATMHTLKAAIERDPRLREQVRLVSMSFDPVHDTPPVMRSYGGPDARIEARPRWSFLTTESSRQLAPLLAGFGQDLRDAGLSQGAGEGGPVTRPVLSHLLKIYLIDGEGDIREIYSPAYLQPAAMLTDIRTLASALTHRVGGQ